MIKSYKQINLCVALYQESDSGLKLSPAGSLLDFMSSVFGESPTATTANHKTCGHVLGCGLNTVRRLLASPSFLLHLSVSSSSSFLSSVWLGLPQPPFVRSPFTPSQSGRKECFTPGLQSCACQRRVCNPPPTLVSADLLFSSDTSTPVCSCLWALCRTWPRDGTGACTDVCRVFTGKNGDNNRNLKCFDALKNTRGVICSEITEHSHDRHGSNFSFCTVRSVSGLSCWFLRILSAAQCVFVSSSSLSLEVFKSQIRVCWREAAGKGRESAVPFVLQHGC